MQTNQTPVGLLGTQEERKKANKLITEILLIEVSRLCSLLYHGPLCKGNSEGPPKIHAAIPPLEKGKEKKQAM